MSPPATDIVSVSALHLSATVGPDHWHRTRPQPLRLSLHLHFSPSYLDTPGQSDDVADSLHYGHLAKAVERRVTESNQERGYPTPLALIQDVTDATFRFVRDAIGGQNDERDRVQAVRVVLELPKQILLARGFEVELTTRASDYWASRSAGVSVEHSITTAGAIVRVKDLLLPVLIGVNPPERLAKQHVIIHITFFEAVGSQDIDYPSIVQQISTDVENSSHLTLEKLVYEIIHTAYRAFDVHSNSNSDVSGIDAITVCCQKPSALSFADASGVEMTRTRRGLGLMSR